MSWKHGECLMFGGYRVDSTQVCDSYKRGRPDSEEKQGQHPTMPHHLHESTGTNRCGNCGYFKP